MEGKLIYGIQQIGVGVDNAEEGFKWYATTLGSDIKVFDDSNTATYMAPYMGGKPHKKRAILAMNMQGGSGYEIWQYLDRKPQKPKEKLSLGDLGIYLAKVKTRNIEISYNRLKDKDIVFLSGIVTEPDGKKCFYIQDPYENVLQIKEFSSWYGRRGRGDTGGLFGCTLGVSDIDRSLELYSGILGYDHTVYDKSGIFPDLGSLPNGKSTFRRVLLAHKDKRSGGFSPLFGESQIELIQAIEGKPNKIFADRYWGDIGFIHLCFDIRNMKALVKECTEKGFPFKVLSDADFDMGEANGHWGYIEDSEGTLIEFVETNKVPLLKKLNISINLKKRDPHKPLPKWLIRALSFNRVKFN
jgi:catechol 2,3-dioxygenase-like lactoylglutathione lyase family enzyme